MVRQLAALAFAAVASAQIPGRIPPTAIGPGTAFGGSGGGGPQLPVCFITNPDPGTCAALYTGSSTITYPLFQWLTDIQQSFTATESHAAEFSFTPVALEAAIWPSETPCYAAQPTACAAQVVPYMTALAAEGVMYQQYTPVQSAFACDSHYTSIGGTNPTCDCNGLTHLPLNTPAPAGSGPLCNALAMYDTIHTTAGTLGVGLLSGQFPTGSTMADCGLTTNGSGVTTMTPTQFIDCMEPPALAEVQRYPALTYMELYEEPLAGMYRLIQYFTVAQTTTIIDTIAAALHAVRPGLSVAASYTGVGSPLNADICGAGDPFDDCYWNAAIVDTNLNSLGIHFFSGKCDQSGDYWYGETQWFHDNFIVPNVAAQSLPLRIQQADGPYFCSKSVASSQANAWIGNGNAVLQNVGYNAAWFKALYDWTASFGGLFASTVGPYCSMIMFYQVTGPMDGTSDHCYNVANPDWSTNALALWGPNAYADYIGGFATGRLR